MNVTRRGASIPGWLPYLKLVAHPSEQLLEVLSSAASFAITESFAGAGCERLAVPLQWMAMSGENATVFATCFGLWALPPAWALPP